MGVFTDILTAFAYVKIYSEYRLDLGYKSIFRGEAHLLLLTFRSALLLTVKETTKFI